MLRNDASWEERRAWGRKQAEVKLAAWEWPRLSPPLDAAEDEARVLSDALGRGVYAGRPVQAAKAQARLRELTGEG